MPFLPTFCVCGNVDWSAKFLIHAWKDVLLQIVFSRIYTTLQVECQLGIYFHNKFLSIIRLLDKMLKYWLRLIESLLGSRIYFFFVDKSLKKNIAKNVFILAEQCGDRSSGCVNEELKGRVASWPGNSFSIVQWCRSNFFKQEHCLFYHPTLNSQVACFQKYKDRISLNRGTRNQSCSWYTWGTNMAKSQRNVWRTWTETADH